MNINKLISIIKNKIEKNISLEYVNIEDKTFLQKSHKMHQDGKFHLKLSIKSSDSEKINKIELTKKIYRILDEELKKYIHSIQILIN